MKALYPKNGYKIPSSDVKKKSEPSDGRIFHVKWSKIACKMAVKLGSTIFFLYCPYGSIFSSSKVFVGDPKLYFYASMSILIRKKYY